MQDLIDRLMIKSKTKMTSDEEVADLARLGEEWSTARQCLNICSEAEYRLKENITTIENYATGDEAVQFLVSTSGKTIHGKNRGFGWRPRQVGGHLSDESLQQLSRDISAISIPDTGKGSSSSRGNTPSIPDDTTERASEFSERYGRGMKLASKRAPDVDMTVESGPGNLTKR
jgi:hypothetical protein